jgi:hypothetical protein
LLGLTNPANWTPIDERTENGTLKCICGVPGRIFVVAGTETIDGKDYSVLRGICGDEHWAIWRGKAIKEAVHNVRTSDSGQQRLF